MLDIEPLLLLHPPARQFLKKIRKVKKRKLEISANLRRVKPENLRTLEHRNVKKAIVTCLQ